MFAVRNRAGIGTVASAAAIALAALAPAGATSQGCSGGFASFTGGTGVRSTTCSSGRYVNPFKGESWEAGRIDMGVDYMPNRRGRVVAIGRAKILGSDSHSGWPGGHFIWYKLLRGDHAGDIIYVAEQLKRLVPAGTKVHAGERIATALPRGTGTEWGWANRRGVPRAAPCYHEGMKTRSGTEMARFLKSLGADVVRKLRPGPDAPSGRRC